MSTALATLIPIEGGKLNPGDKSHENHGDHCEEFAFCILRYISVFSLTLVSAPNAVEKCDSLTSTSGLKLR